MPSRETKYEFGGPFGAAAIVCGLPLLLQVFALTCNDVAGCPVPSLLHPSTLSWAQLKLEMGWPAAGLAGFFTLDAFAVILAYYLFSLVLWRFLPAQEVLGGKTPYNQRPLKYRFNGFASSLVHLAICALGTYLYGADFVVWTYIADNYAQLLAATTVIAIAIAVWVYVRSFSVDTNYPNADQRELAVGGQTGNIIYDFYIGRELNPRVTLPVFGEVDIKTFLEMRPGLTGWVLLDLAFVAKQYRAYGFVSDSILLVTVVQAWYALYGQYNEPGILTMIDITTDGFGFMLSFGDVPWVPFLYSTQCRYLAAYPQRLGPVGIVLCAAIFVLGLYIFKAANTQKHLFRTHPDDPAVRDLRYLQTKRGTRLLTQGWWGVARHINYFGDWLQAIPFSLPTGLAGYTVLPAASAAAAAAAAGGQGFQMLDGTRVVQGDAAGWGVFFTYFYALYFATLLMHREGRDEAACVKKYGDDWAKYKKIVKYRFVPYLF